MNERLRIGIAEAVGTMILVVGGPGTAILATGHFLPGGSVGVLGVALAFGLSLLCAAYAIGSISGCHVSDPGTCWKNRWYRPPVCTTACGSLSQPRSGVKCTSGRGGSATTQMMTIRGR